MSPNPLLTVREVADQLQVTEETVRRWIRRGELIALELGGPRIVYRIRPEDFDRFVWQRYTVTTAPTATPTSNPQTQPNFQDMVERLPVVSFVFEPEREWPGTVTYISREIQELLGVPWDQWYADSRSVWQSLVPPQDMAEMEQRARNFREQWTAGSNRDRNDFATEFRLMSRRHQLVWFSLDMELVRSESGEPLYWSGVMVDITRRKQIEQELGDRLLREQRLEVFTKHAIEEERLTVLFNEAVHMVTEVMHVEYARVFEVMPGGQYMTLRSTLGWAPGQVGIQEVEAGAVGQVIVDTASDSHASYTLNAGEAIVSEDLAIERRFNGQLMVTRRGLWSGLYGLIPGKGRPFGVLGAHAAERRSYTAADVDFLKAVATTLGMAVSRSGERWLTIPEIASTLQVNLETVRRWIRSGDLSAVLLGGTRTGYRIHSSDLQRFTEQRLTS